MKMQILTVMLFMALIAGCAGGSDNTESGGAASKSGDIALPAPRTKGRMSFEEAVNRRQSVRSFDPQPLSLKDVSQLLWAAGGLRVDAVSSASRTAPSAGGAYPLEYYLVAGNVEGLKAGIYHYLPSEHSLRPLQEGDKREALAAAALGQVSVRTAPVTIVMAAEYSRTTGRYGQRGEKYVYMDAGHSGENIYLCASALGLGTVAVGAFEDEKVKGVVGPGAGQDVIYLFPIGKAKPIGR